MAMRNKTIEEGVITTPMRKLIKKLPGKIMKAQHLLSNSVALLFMLLNALWKLLTLLRDADYYISWGRHES